MKITTPDGVERQFEPRPYILLGYAGATPLPLSLTASGGLLGTMGGYTSRVRAAFVRPADTTAYAAGDCVANSTSAPVILKLENVARVAGGTGYITDLKLATSSATVTNASFQVILFSTAVAIPNDNAAWTELWADDASRIAAFDFTLTSGGGGSTGASQVLSQLGQSYQCASDSRDLFAVIVAKGAYVPTSGQSFAVTLGSAND